MKLRLVYILLWLTGQAWTAPDENAADLPSPGRSMWVYQTEALAASPAAREELFVFCRERHISVLFWQVHFENSSKGGTLQFRREAELGDFMRDATQHHLRIHALAGDPSHTHARNHDRVLARVDALLEFNRTHGVEARFSGLHLDIEPHGLPEWKMADDPERCRLLTEFVELNAKVVERLDAGAAQQRARPRQLVYGADITFWLDQTKADGTPRYPVMFRGVTKDPTRHLLDMVDNLALMSYRGKAEGRNGIIDIVSRTIAHADEVQPPRRVLVGVKMADIGPGVESFFGRTEAEMNAELQKVENAFAGHEGYGGIAFFMYAAYKEMPRTW